MMATKIVKINDAQALKAAAASLRKGGTLVYPTETCYGLGADAANKHAIKKIYALKHRSARKKTSIACSSLAMAERHIKISKKAALLAKAFMPGPLTIVSKGKSFRIPGNRFCLKLIRKFGKPITATSANVSGEKSIHKIKDAIKTFYGKVDVIVDAGNLPQRRPSTVFDVDSMQVLRRGAVTPKQIKKALGNR